MTNKFQFGKYKIQNLIRTFDPEPSGLICWNLRIICDLFFVFLPTPCRPCLPAGRRILIGGLSRSGCCTSTLCLYLLQFFSGRCTNVVVAGLIILKQTLQILPGLEIFATSLVNIG